MRKDTRFKFNAYLSRVAELNGVDTDDVAKKFTVEPSVTQTLMTTLQASSAFLTKVNIVPVDELKGEKVGVGVNGTIASTTDTAADDERKTADFTALESNKYECAQINFDFHIRYKQLDLWARFQDFQTRIRDAIIKRQSLDFIMAGFNGITRAATSNRKQNPLLQDVAVGWLQKYLNMFNDGLSYMGVVESVTLPKLTRKLEKYRGGGMPGAVSVDLGLDDDALSLEWTLGGLPDIELWAQYASPGADSVPLRFTGSYQRDDTGAISAVEVVMRGRHKEYDGGENKQGESGTTKMATECAYYQLTIDGKEVIEIDVINMVLKVDGVDRMAEHRKAIGL